MSLPHIPITLICHRCGEELHVHEPRLGKGLGNWFTVRVLPCKKCNQAYSNLVKALNAVTKEN